MTSPNDGDDSAPRDSARHPAQANPDETSEMILPVDPLMRAQGQTWRAAPAPVAGPSTPPRPRPGIVRPQGRLSATPEGYAFDPVVYWRHIPPDRYPGLPTHVLDRVLRCVRDLFIEADFERLTLDTIIARAKLNAEESHALCAHFGYGLALGHVFVEGFYHDLLNDLAQGAVDSGTVFERLTRLGQTHLKRIIRDPGLYLTIHDLNLRGDARAHAPRSILQRVDNANRRSRHVLATLVAEGQMRDELIDGAPKAIALWIVNALYGLVTMVNHPHHLISENLYVFNAAQQHLRLILNGLRKHPTP